MNFLLCLLFISPEIIVICTTPFHCWYFFAVSGQWQLRLLPAAKRNKFASGFLLASFYQSERRRNSEAALNELFAEKLAGWGKIVIKSCLNRRTHNIGRAAKWKQFIKWQKSFFRFHEAQARGHRNRERIDWRSSFTSKHSRTFNRGASRDGWIKILCLHFVGSG